MFGFRLFLAGLLVGTCAGLFVANYHVVNTPQGVVVVPRAQRPPLRSSYVDIRSWSQAMWVNHPEVTQALIADGRSSLIRDNLKDNLQNEILPEQSQDDRSRRSRDVAGPSEIPIRMETDRTEVSPLVTDSAPAAREKTRLLDSQSPVRKRFESALDEVIAPMVEDDPAEPAGDSVASDPLSENLPSNEEMIQKLEARLGGLLNEQTSEIPEIGPSRLEAVPTSGDAEEMARDLLQQVIPQGSNLPRSATPFRDFGRDLLSAPAPGQGGASQTLPRPTTQSLLNLSEPF